MNPEFFQKRRAALSALLPEKDAVLLLSSGCSLPKSADESFDFQVNTNFFYLTGIRQEKTVLALIKEKGEVRTALFIDEYDENYAKWIGHRLTKEEAGALCGLSLSSIFWKGEMEDMLSRLAVSRPSFYLDLEPNNAGLTTFGMARASLLKEKFGIEAKDAYPLIVRLRMAKDESEIEALKAAIEVTGKGIEAMMAHARPGLYEYELEAWFDYTVKALGHPRFSFKTIAAAGANATTLHYSENNTKTKDGDLILFDLGVKHGEYCADISRTFPVNGTFSPLQKVIYEIVLAANKKIIETARAGMTIGELQKITVDVLAEGCLAAGLIKEPDEIRRVYFHSISHSIGLDTHDPFPRNAPLPEGAVISDEPGLYFPEHGIGVRIEDDLLITKEGAVNLSAGIMKEVSEIEAFMGRQKSAL